MSVQLSIFAHFTECMDDKANKDLPIKNLILDIFTTNYCKYGVPRITLELRNRGININKKRVERLMKELKIKARPHTKRYNSYKGEIGKICKNQLLKEEEKDKEPKQPTDVPDMNLDDDDNKN